MNEIKEIFELLKSAIIRNNSLQFTVPILVYPFLLTLIYKITPDVLKIYHWLLEIILPFILMIMSIIIFVIKDKQNNPIKNNILYLINAGEEALMYGNLKSAYEYFQTAVKQAEGSGEIELEIKSSQNLAKAFLISKDFLNAYEEAKRIFEKKYKKGILNGDDIDLFLSYTNKLKEECERK